MNQERCCATKGLLNGAVIMIVAFLVAWPSSARAQSQTAASSGAELEPRRRLKPLQVTIGVPPTAQDVGSEADLLGSGAREDSFAVALNRWVLRMKGYVRAPLRIGLGQRNDKQPGTEAHIPPRIVGLSSGTWEYIAIAPNPSVSMYFNYGNPVVSANVIFNTNTLIDAGYRNIDQIGGISAAYLALKFPAAFGHHGGLSVTAGAFGNRYGLAGPRGTSSGYYGTYLFGRNHQTGEVVTANFDINDRLQVILEHGLGAKLEVIPFISAEYPSVTPGDQPGAPEADWLQGQGPTPMGSTFLHHAHAGLMVDDWLKVGYHFLTAWTPGDLSRANEPMRGEARQGNSICVVGSNPAICRPVIPAEEGRITVAGADLHVDSDRTGNGYIGYSHARGDNVWAVADANQFIHSSTGRSFKENYFGRKDPFTNIVPTNASGTVDTLLYQYIFRLSAIANRPLGTRELTLATFGMYNKVRSPKENPEDPFQLNINLDKFKFGGEIQAEIHRHLTFGFRADRVIPDLAETSAAYSAISPRLILYSKRKSKEYIIVNYTRYFLGPRTYPGSPYADYPLFGLRPDKNLLMIMAIMSFGP